MLKKRGLKARHIKSIHSSWHSYSALGNCASGASWDGIGWSLLCLIVVGMLILHGFVSSCYECPYAFWVHSKFLVVIFTAGWCPLGQVCIYFSSYWVPLNTGEECTMMLSPFSRPFAAAWAYHMSPETAAPLQPHSLPYGSLSGAAMEHQAQPASQPSSRPSHTPAPLWCHHSPSRGTHGMRLCCCY